MHVKRKIAAAALAMLMVVATSGDDASAWRTVHRQGTVTGRVVTPNVQFWRQRVNYPCRPGGVPTVCPVDFLNVMTTDVLRVHRAPRKGKQNIVARYVLQKWVNDAWRTRVQSAHYTGRIGRNQKWIRVPQWNTSPNAPKGYWRMVYIVGWSRANGKHLGTKAIAPSRKGEQYCIVTQVRCIPHANYMHVLSL